MAANYYCLIAGLPTIYLDDNKLSYDSNRFYEDLQRDITSKDQKLFTSFRGQKDNANILNYLTKQEKPFINGGSFGEDELKEIVENPTTLPSYLQEFIVGFKDNLWDANANFEVVLLSLYQDYLLNQDNQFLKEWFEFELNLLNISTAINCRKYQLDPKEHIIGSNSVAETLKKSTARDFGLSELPYLNQLLQIYEMTSLLEREKALDLLRWNTLEEMTFFYYFTAERLFAYYWKLTVVERWLSLDIETGRELFNQMLNDLKKSYEFPEEFR